jgi:hypothetical protein
VQYKKECLAALRRHKHTGSAEVPEAAVQTTKYIFEKEETVYKFHGCVMPDLRAMLERCEQAAEVRISLLVLVYTSSGVRRLYISRRMS